MTLDARIVWEARDSAVDALGGGGVRWVSLVESGTYEWTESGSGTAEFYCDADGGGDPGLTEAKAVTTDGTYVSDTNGAMGSLNAGEWDWGDNDTLGYSTVYVRLDDDADPDTKNDDFVSMIFGGGVDYSMQDAAQWSEDNLSTDGAGTQVTDDDANGTVTALMVGNIIMFDGAWYEVATFIDGDNFTIDRSAGAGLNGKSGKIGGARDIPLDAHFEAWTPGNKMYMEAGTYTLGAAVAVALDGTAVAPMVVEGYNSARGDAPTGTDRPVVVAAANSFDFDNYWTFFHIRLTTTTGSGWRTDISGAWHNCKSQNTSGTAGRDAFYSLGSAGLLRDSEAISDAGDGIFARAGTRIQLSYLHDCGVSGVELGVAGEGCIEDCIIDTCTGKGINLASNDEETIRHNTIYNCGVGIDATDGNVHHITNNLIDTCTTGCNWTTEQRSNFMDYNNFNGNTTDVIKIRKGPNATALVPGFENAVNGLFGDVDVADGKGMGLGV